MNHENVQDYYGTVLQSSDDLQTDACCTSEAMPDHLKVVLAKLHDEVMARYYGCGLIAPQDLSGMRILDLGCGAGRDVYALSAMVGSAGRVVGVDMTPEQLDVARAHREFHAKAFGYAQSNVEFHHGFIEKLDELDLEPGSFDIIVSNCVINLAMDKGAVLRGVHHLLKDGGEMYFSDVYSDRRVPEELAKDAVLYGECLSGALYRNDFLRLAKLAGFGDPRLVTSRPLAIDNHELAERVAPIRFESTTYRLFKLPALEPDSEDYGQKVIYKGSIEHFPDAFELDSDHLMPTGQEIAVCGNTWRMLKETRLARHFECIGDFSTHHGGFADCRGQAPAASESSCC